MSARPDGDPAGGRTSVRTLALLALWIGSVAVLSLWPFGPLVASWSEFGKGLVSGIALSIGWPLWETLTERILAFLPIGFLLYGWFVRLAVRVPARRTLAAAAAIALAAETAQGAIESRHARLSDLILATVAAALGVALCVFLQRNPERRHRILFAGLFVTGSLLAAAIPALAQLGLRIGGWDCGYPLILGNELTGNRPWRGSVAGFAIYRRALPDAEIRALAVLPPGGWRAEPRRAAGAILVSRRADAPLRFGADAAAARRVLTFDPVTSRGICEAISASREFTVELVVRSADTSQFGPARIISMSRDTMLRNFTVGQAGAEVVLRVRTPRSGPNGRILERRTSNRALGPGWHHVVARYGDTGGAIFVDGAAAGRATRYRDTLSIPPFEYRIHLGWIVALIGLGAGACAARAFPRLGRTVLLVTAASGAISAAVAGSVGVWTGGVDRFVLVAAAAAPSLGCATVLGLAPRLGPNDAHPATCRTTSRKRLPKAFQFRRPS